MLTKMEISNLSDTEFKTLFIRMLQEISRYFNSMKKTPAEVEDTLTEIKNNLQGIDSRVDEATRIKSMIRNIRKKTKSTQYSKKRNI